MMKYGFDSFARRPDMMNDELFSKVDNYISSLLEPEDKVLTDVVKSIEEEGLPLHSISANQGKFLQVMMIACNAKNVTAAILQTIGIKEHDGMAIAVVNRSNR